MPATPPAAPVSRTSFMTCPSSRSRAAEAAGARGHPTLSRLRAGHDCPDPGSGKAVELGRVVDEDPAAYGLAGAPAAQRIEQNGLVRVLGLLAGMRPVGRPQHPLR